MMAEGKGGRCSFFLGERRGVSPTWQSTPNHVPLTPGHSPVGRHHSLSRTFRPAQLSRIIVSQKWSLELQGDVAILTSTVSPRRCDCGGMCCGCWGVELTELCRPLTARVVVLDMSGIDMTDVVRPDLQLLEAAIRETKRAKQRGAECRACVAPYANETIAITKADRFVSFYPDRASALAGLTDPLSDT